MPVRTVGLVTRDPALYAELAAAVRERGWRSVSLLPGDRIPDHVGVVVTSEAEAPRILHPHVVAVGPAEDRRTLWTVVATLLEASAEDGEWIVGVDPGPRPGYAILCGSRTVGEGCLDRPEAVGELADHLAHRAMARRLRFRVGSGDPLARDRMVNALVTQSVPVEIVDEAGTTPSGGRRKRDPAAARSIARQSGRAVGARRPLRITPGEVANLQHLSRIGSGGRLTISRADARRVLEGRLSLSDAVRRAERGGAPGDERL